MPVWGWICLGLLGGGLLVLFCWWQNKGLTKTRICLDFSRVETPFRLIHLSDLHARSFGRGNARLLAMIREEAPDGIAITGDLVGRFSRRTDPMFSLLEKLCRIAPVYYVSGNHEYGRRDREEIFARAAQAGAVVLRHVMRRDTIGGQELWILGLDEMGYHRESRRLLEQFSQKEGFKLLLSHFTERFAGEYREYDIDLILTGHAHGGQFILPWIGGVYSPGQGLFPKYYRGVYREQGSVLVVSRGMGNSRFPLRLFNRPEVVVIDIRPKRAEEK